jgi:uncharacterized protein
MAAAAVNCGAFAPYGGSRSKSAFATTWAKFRPIFIAIAAIACIWITFAGPWTRAAYAFTPPAKVASVTDLAQVLTDAERVEIGQKLVAYNKQNGFSLVVLTVRSLDGMPIEDYAYETAKAWNLGDAARDDGVLLLVAKAERKIRIETGKGADGVLTDLQANVIIREVMGPKLRRGNYGEGITAGVDALGAALSNLPIPDSLKGASSRMRSGPGANAGFGFGMIMIIGGGLILMLLLSVVIAVTRRLRGQHGAGWSSGNGYDVYGNDTWNGGNSWTTNHSTSLWSGGGSFGGGGGDAGGNSDIGGSDFGGGGGDFGGGGSSGDY